jgi:hypothetical protein
MATTIYKISSYVIWNSKQAVLPMGIVNNTTVNNTMTSTEHHNDLLGIQGGEDTSYEDSNGIMGEYYHLDASSYFALLPLVDDSVVGNSKYYGTNNTGVKGFNSFPIATASTLGMIIVGTGLTIDSNGVLNVIGGGYYDSSGAGGPAVWGDISGDIGLQIDLQTALGLKLNSAAYTAADVLAKLLTVDGAASGLDADLLDGQHGSYYATKIHNLIDTTNHPVTGLTAGYVLKALSATTYGFAVPGYIVASRTPVDNQVAVFVDATTIEGHTGFTYDSATGTLGVQIIDAGDGVGRGLSLYAGDAVGSTGTPGGNLTLKAGDAKTSDSTSHSGVIYLLHGETYPASTAVLLDVVGDATDIDLIIIQKGAGMVQLGTPGGDASIYGMDVCINSTSNTLYLGDKASGCLPAKTSETNVVYYDPTTGLLSYGTVTGGTSGDVYTDHIHEITAAHGVDIDTFNLKDGTRITSSFGSDYYIDFISLGYNFQWTDSNHYLRFGTQANYMAFILGSSLNSGFLFNGDISLASGNIYTMKDGITVGLACMIKGGKAIGIGSNYAGGDLLLYGGTPTGAGAIGKVFIGTGSAGTNPLAGSGTGTSILLYNRTTGEITFGDK